MSEIEKIIRQVLSTYHIVAVDAEESKNEDGEAILFLTIVFDEAKSEMLSDAAIRVSKSIWNHLDANSIDQFPVTSFVSKSDYEGMIAA